LNVIEPYGFGACLTAGNQEGRQVTV